MQQAIKRRRRPAYDRVLRRSFGDQVPQVIEAYAATLLAQALETVDEGEVDTVIQKIKRKFAVHHVAHRDSFQELFLRKRAHPVEIKIDWATERVYLVGIGLPDREELEVHKRAIQDRHGDTQFYQKETVGTQADDTVLAYTEVSWRDVRRAENRAEELKSQPVAPGMPGCPTVAESLQKFFQLPPYQLPASILALDSYSDDDLKSIALYAFQNSS